jgi:hypothetical protein
MAGYFICFLLGFIAGLILEDMMNSDTKIEYSGTIKQKGQNNRLQIKKEASEGKPSRKWRKSKKRRDKG